MPINLDSSAVDLHDVSVYFLGCFRSRRRIWLLPLTWPPSHFNGLSTEKNGSEIHSGASRRQMDASPLDGIRDIRTID